MVVLKKFSGNEALNHTESGLTYPALVGLRKQSVEDAERMFSPTLLAFMEKKGYVHEADYIRLVTSVV